MACLICTLGHLKTKLEQHGHVWDFDIWPWSGGLAAGNTCSWGPLLDRNRVATGCWADAGC